MLIIYMPIPFHIVCIFLQCNSVFPLLSWNHLKRLPAIWPVEIGGTDWVIELCSLRRTHSSLCEIKWSWQSALFVEGLSDRSCIHIYGNVFISVSSEKKKKKNSLNLYQLPVELWLSLMKRWVNIDKMVHGDTVSAWASFFMYADCRLCPH